MIKTASGPEKSFEQGKYQEVLEKLDGKKQLSHSDITALIGAHAFLGNLEEAVDLWEIHNQQLNEIQKTRCRFCLGVAATRVSKLKWARRQFRTNYAQAKDDSLAYAYQGIAFYLYFVGRFSRAKMWVRKALKASLASGDGYIRFLATDLLGHCTVQLGSRAEGLHLLEEAKKLAEVHGNLNFAHAFASSSLIYAAEAGWRPDTMSAELEETLRDLDVQDSYTRNNLVLELSRQWTLRGKWKQARELLDRESSGIYAFGNRRQEFVLQMRLAEIAYRQGDKFAVSHFLQSGRRCLNKISDRAFEIRQLGLELKFRKLYGGSTKDIEKQLYQLSEEHSSRINDQIMFRLGGGKNPRTSASEDPIYHLYLQAKENPKRAAEKALEIGYLSLWTEFQGLKPGSSFFHVLEDGTSVVVGSVSQVVYRPKALTHQYLKIIQALKNGQGTKEDLINKVWGYEYDPARHDSSVYSSIAKLRKILEPQSEWIKTTDTGWELYPEVEWSLPKMAGAKAPKAIPQPMLQMDPSDPVQLDWAKNLNFRQIRALRERPQEGFWSIKNYKQLFKVSTMTAFRDLTGLLEGKFLIQSGRGRATRYHIRGE
ncbi:MAG: hypothetical protein V4736_05530 [Bdellovibrionota bacterium]